MARIDFQRTIVEADRLIRASRIEVCCTQVCHETHISRIQNQRSLIVNDRLFVSPCIIVLVGQVGYQRGILRCSFYRSLQGLKISLSYYGWVSIGQSWTLGSFRRWV